MSLFYSKTKRKHLDLENFIGENAALSTRRFNPRMDYHWEYELKATTMFSTDEFL